MAKSRIKVSQQWQRHFAAPVALMRCSRETGDVLAVDEDSGLYLLDQGGTVLLSKQLPWMPAAVALSMAAQKFALVSQSGTLLVVDRHGNIVDEYRTVLRPTSLDMSLVGDRIAFADGSGKTGTIDIATRKATFLETAVPYYYARFAALSSQVVAVGQYGQVLFHDDADGTEWQKDYHCHTRQPALVYDPLTILIPSPHYGIISVGANGSENGLFEAPGGPKAIAVTADGGRIFVFNEKNEVIIFESNGRLLFRQPLGMGVLACECSSDGSSLVAVMTTGAIERFTVGQTGGSNAPYVEFAVERPYAATEGPASLWRTKVFSALGGQRWGQLAVTPSARYVALLDVEANLRIFDQTGKQTSDAIALRGRQPAVKAGRSNDLVVAASSDNLVAIDMRGYRQRRLSLRNEWSTHFDIAPKGLFFAVSDFFRGVSFFDETLDRLEYVETGSDVLDLAVDGNHHTLLSLADGRIAFYSEKGALIRQTEPMRLRASAIVSLGQGFLVAAGGLVQAFDSEGTGVWSLELPGGINLLQPTRAGIAISTAEGDTFLTNAHGAVINKMLRRNPTKYFTVGPDSREIHSVEYRGRLLTARSTESGVLWRREAEDDILAVEVSPDGTCIAVLAGIYLSVLSTLAGPKAPGRQTYLEI